MPAFLGFTGITYVAFWGHIVFALVAAAVIESQGLLFEPKQRRAVQTA